jgi:2-dehydro-3-deoxyphosphogluconate aldolase / (4S)-4-hydroxy-2-oxoglutarate aldolase
VSGAGATGSDPDRWFDQAFEAQRVMGILRGHGPQTVTLAAAAWSVGIEFVEVTIQSEGDLDALVETVAAGQAQGRVVGAGTVTSVKLVAAAATAGAAFTVSPGLDLDVVRASLDAGLPSLPGVATASEIQRALDFGLHWMKAFPATALGPEWLAAMTAPFPHVQFVATGGITPANAAKFLDAGARVVAIGSALADPIHLNRLGELNRTRPGANRGR